MVQALDYRCFHTLFKFCHLSIRLFVLPLHSLPRFKMLNLLFLSFPKQVGQAKDELLTSQLIDHLMGESDGMPKVPFSPLGLSILVVLLLLSALFWSLADYSHGVVKESDTTEAT